MVFNSECHIPLTNFPFDVQMCDLKFGSWTNDQSRVDIIIPQTEKIGHGHAHGYSNADEYVKNPMWHLVDYPAKKSVKSYASARDVRYVDVKHRGCGAR